MIFFLYGDDTYRSTQKAKAIQDKFVAEVDPQKFNLSVIDGESVSVGSLMEQLGAMPFLATKRMVVVRDLISKNKKKEVSEALTEFLEGKDRDDRIVLFWESSKPKGKNKNWDILKKSKFAQEFQLLKPQEVQKWITTDVQAKSGTIEPQAVSYLAANIGNDLWQMHNELEKLFHYCDGAITRQASEMMVQAGFDDNIFNFTDALGAKNKAQALKLLSDQLHSGANELYILSMLTRQYKILLEIKSVIETNPQAQKNAIAQELGLHPFVVQKSLAQVNNYSMDKLKSIYSALLNIDYQLKSSNTKPELLFDLFIAQV